MKLPLKAEPAIVLDFTNGPTICLRLESTWEGFCKYTTPDGHYKIILNDDDVIQASPALVEMLRREEGKRFGAD